MTTTIHADGPLYVGPPYATASFNDLFTVLHVLVGAVFVLSGLVAMVAVAVMVFSGGRGCGPSRASLIAGPRDGGVLRDGCLDHCVGDGRAGQGPAHPARRDGARGRGGVVHRVAGVLLRRVP